MGEPIVIAATSAAGKPIVEKLFGKLGDLISKPVSLPFNCKSNVEDLKKKVAELEGKKISMEKSKEDAERSGKEIDSEFQKCLDDAGNLIDAAKEVVVKEDEEKAKKKRFYRFGGICLYLVPRYKLSKKAKQNSVSIDQQISKVSNYPLPIAHPPAPLRETDTGGKSFEEFPSRGRVLDQIMEELRGTRVNRIGIHGMPGAGKTTLAKEVKRRAEEEPDHGFVKVVLAKVTLTPDWKSIREEIARGLGMDLLSGGLTSQQTADTIRAKLSKEIEKGNVLVILDDIWDRIDLEEVGIPLKEADASGGNCEKLKILMTSRDCNVLEIQMSSQLNFLIGDLKYEEALRLFEKIVGDKANDPELKPMASGIVWKCGGLPLAVATLANALKKGIPHEWKNALKNLMNPSPDNFTGVPNDVHNAIEVSYNQLGDEKLQQTFLLCAMMGRNVSIEYSLLRVGVGLGLFSPGNTIEDSRNELLTLIDNLKAASLLIDGYSDGHLDMHDLIHDVAIAIASKDGQWLLVSKDQELEELPDLEAVNGFKWVMMDQEDNSVLRYELEGPQLTFLHIENYGSSLEIPENFFKRVERLKVLHLIGVHMPSLPSSPCFLENLHTLVLYQSVLGDMSIIGKLKSLEILSLVLFDVFEELPKEFAELTRLKILDLGSCSKLIVIPPHVLESLSRLEELYLPRIFQRWKLGEHGNQENASLAELKHLKKLTTLEIWIGNARMIPKDFLLVNFYRIWIWIL